MSTSQPQSPTLLESSDQSDPAPGYSITERHWNNSRLYERCVEQICHKPYLSFVREFYKNEKIIISYCKGGTDITEDVIVSADYTNYLYKLIIYKAHQLYYGNASRAEFTSDEYYDIEQSARSSTD